MRYEPGAARVDPGNPDGLLFVQVEPGTAAMQYHSFILHLPRFFHAMFGCLCSATNSITDDCRAPI